MNLDKYTRSVPKPKPGLTISLFRRERSVSFLRLRWVSSHVGGDHPPGAHGEQRQGEQGDEAVCHVRVALRHQGHDARVESSAAPAARRPRSGPAAGATGPPPRRDPPRRRPRRFTPAPPPSRPPRPGRRRPRTPSAPASRRRPPPASEATAPGRPAPRARDRRPSTHRQVGCFRFITREAAPHPPAVEPPSGR